MNYFAHFSAVIDENVEIGKNCNVVFQRYSKKYWLWDNMIYAAGVELAHSFVICHCE